MTANRVRAVQERRRSNAAGAHGTKPTRASMLATALADYDERTNPMPDTETTDEDTCGACGQAYSAHCKDCYNCLNAHDEYCGW